jgi:L-iditol 2-dehydrogenase
MIAYLYKGEKVLRLEEVPEPVKTENNAIVRIEAASICGTDIRTYRFGSSKIRFPMIIGHECIGEIVHIGKAISGFDVGDRIQIAPAIGCGECYPCRKGHPNLCDHLETIGFQYNGAFAESMEVPKKAFGRGNVSKVDKRLPVEAAVLAEPIACVLNAHEYIDLQEADHVAIFGSGFIGLMHAQIAFNKGAANVILMDINKTRIDQAKEIMPNLTVLNAGNPDLKDEILGMTGGNGVDAAIVACSSGDAQKAALDITAKNGRISLFGGLPGKETRFLDSNIIHYKEISVFGVHASTPAQNRTAMKMISDGELNVDPFIHDTFELKDIEKAFGKLMNEEILKAIING